MNKNDINILGISCYYHDASAAHLSNGEIISAFQEERFTRIKFDPNFPINSINSCMDFADININEFNCVAFYENPNYKLERLLQSYKNNSLLNIFQNTKKIKNWIKDKYNFLEEFYSYFPNFNGDVYFVNHHLSHASAAFFPSNFEDSAILTIDGVGEDNCTTIGHGLNNQIKILEEQKYPNSIGLVYSTFTSFLGFKVLSGEYKLMGLAPYGEPKFYKLIKENLLEISENGEININLDYFDFNSNKKMYTHKLSELLKIKPVKENDQITVDHMNIASSIQKVTDEFVLKNAKYSLKITESKNLCMSGGVALNCVANQKILNKINIKNIWIQPASGDAGNSLGAAFFAYYKKYQQRRIVNKNKDFQKFSLLGNEYTNDQIEDTINLYNLKYDKLTTNKYNIISELLSKKNIIGLFNGRMEFGPRALGNRSIIGDPRDPNMQNKMNLKIKFRESFRPFAPIVLEEFTEDWFNFSGKSPYMLFTAFLNENKKINSINNYKGFDKLKFIPSKVPAVTHVDFSARIQTVSKDSNFNLYSILYNFYKITGCPILINTSFNVRGEPIVCSPKDALACFFQTDIDYLFIGDFLLSRKNQNIESIKKEFKKFDLD